MSRRHLGRWLLIGALASALGGLTLSLGACNTPFIPIPPPGDPSFKPIATQDAMGTQHTIWETSGAANPAMAGAQVYVYNRALGVGVIARASADGAYVATPIDGRVGDPIELFYETPKGERSTAICRGLQEGPAHNACP